MFVALLLASASIADWVPMRWFSADPQSLELLADSPVNCLLLEQRHWSPDLLKTRRGLALLAVVRDAAAFEKARSLPFDGFVLEGEFAQANVASEKPLIRLPARRGIRFEDSGPVLGTWQGVWPGIEIEHGGPQVAAPTGSAWIHTNTGFLRFVRSATRAAFWLGVTPLVETEYNWTRYAQAIADAYSVGARWIVSLDAGMEKRLLAREPAALASWKRVQAHLRFYEQHKDWRSWTPRSQLALVQDAASGALITGGLLDMLSVMNTPVRAVPTRELGKAELQGTKVTVTLNPQAYTAEQKAMIARFAEQGGAVVQGDMPQVAGERIVFSRSDYKQLESIWPELHSAVARKNFGVRMFNVTGTLSYLLDSPDRRRAVLQLVNFTDYEVESVTAFVQGKYRKATLYTPEAAPRDLTVYDAPEGTGVEIDRLGVCGAVVVE